MRSRQVSIYLLPMSCKHQKTIILKALHDDNHSAEGSQFEGAVLDNLVDPVKHLQVACPGMMCMGLYRDILGLYGDNGK